jgi:hypothetical protein
MAQPAAPLSEEAWRKKRDALELRSEQDKAAAAVATTALLEVAQSSAFFDLAEGSYTRASWKNEATAGSAA